MSQQEQSCGSSPRPALCLQLSLCAQDFSPFLLVKDSLGGKAKAAAGAVAVFEEETNGWHPQAPKFGR